MATLDFARDLMDTLKEQNINFVLLTFQKNGKEGKECLINNFTHIEPELKGIVNKELQHMAKNFSVKPTKKKTTKSCAPDPKTLITIDDVFGSEERENINPDSLNFN